MTDEREVMQIPKEVILNGLPITTEFSDTLLVDYERYGEYCTRMMKITVDSNLCIQRAGLSWFHEYVEAVIDTNKLDITDEQVKQAFGGAMYQLMMQHKKFFCKKNEE
jgi:hypothetical protein